jgi:predicted nucleic acid-binding protein
VALGEPVFFDTSVLIGGLIELGSETDPAQRILSAVADGVIQRPHTAWHCCLEFYSVATRLPPDLRLSPAEALQLVEEEILVRFQVHQLPETLRPGFFLQAAHDGVVGGRVYDAHIAEVARGARAEVVVTENTRHFTSLLRHGIRVFSTGEFSQQL